MIETVGIVGAGTMGTGLAELCSIRGFAVRVCDSSPDAVVRSLERLTEGLERRRDKGKLSETEVRRAVDAVSYVAGLGGLSGAEIVIEAASEDLKIKQRIFKELGALDGERVLATNTSSLPVWAIAQACRAPERVVGMHFFNPPQVMRLVEIARTPQTLEGPFRTAWKFAAALGKTPIAVKDTPGFVVNRVMRAYYLGGLRLANEGAGIDDVDRACREHGGVPMGPFELMDLIGVDVNLAITRVIYEALGRPERMRPSIIQEWLVGSGNMGQKVGKGFYIYSDAPPTVNPEVRAILPEPARFAAPDLWTRVLRSLGEEARRVAEEGVAVPEDIDTAVKLATNFPKGPFEWEKDLPPTA